MTSRKESNMEETSLNHNYQAHNTYTSGSTLTDLVNIS